MAQSPGHSREGGILFLFSLSSSTWVVNRFCLGLGRVFVSFFLLSAL